MHNNIEYYRILGQFLKIQRERSKITVQQIADNLGVSHQQIRKYESGSNRIPVDKLDGYCDTINFKVSWILEMMDERRVA